MRVRTIEDQNFPISSSKKTTGNRRIVRIKVLQILVAYQVSQTDLSRLFNHIFYRDFYDFEDDDSYEKLITDDNLITLKSTAELANIYSDSFIEWNRSCVRFAKELLRLFVAESELITNLIAEVSENWEVGRMSLIDKTIIIMIATEFLHFPDIPVKASINEGVELSKIFSTEKSFAFVNGIIEKLRDIFTENSLIQKSEIGSR